MKVLKIKLLQFLEDNLSNILDSCKCEEIEFILDQRDESSFSDQWMQIYNEVKVREKEDTLARGYATEIREFTFKKIIEQNGNADLAAYVSDDFALIFDALINQYNNHWLTALWVEYKNGKIPHGILKEKTDTQLVDLL